MATNEELPLERKTVKGLTLLSLKRSFDMFAGNHGEALTLDEESQRVKIACKIRDDYSMAQHVTAAAAPSGSSTKSAAQGSAAPSTAAAVEASKVESRSAVAKLIDSIPAGPPKGGAPDSSTALVLHQPQKQQAIMEVLKEKSQSSAAVSRRIASKWPKPVWHAPWKLYRVISGHLGCALPLFWFSHLWWQAHGQEGSLMLNVKDHYGWVRCLAFDPSNEWFCTGSADRTIKIWDTASGQLKLTLTGHVEQVTGIAVSPRHPYMFSCGLDKMVKCWDLEQNKVIRNYHGHLSGVYSLCLHPTLDLLMTGGRDSVCRVWDMRTKVQIHCLSGHDQTVCSILSQPTDPQVITGSHDSTIRLWDLRKAKTFCTLTFHKKSVRAMALHPTEHAFASASADNIKKFKLPDGEFLHNMLQQQRAIVNALAVNEDGVMASGGDAGSMWFWDWRSGNCFQQQESLVQPGSLDAEAGIFGMSFDQSGSRLVTCEADKTIKMWREDERATPETHPVNFRPPKDIKRF